MDLNEPEVSVSADELEPALAPEPSEVEPVEPHPHPGPEPGYMPPAASTARGLRPTIGVLGSVVCAGTLMTLTSQRNPLLDLAANPQPPAEVAPSAEPDRIASSRPLELPGPPAPEPEPSAPNAVASAASGMSAVASGRPRGHIGYMGPIGGSLNTDLTGVGPVRGPIWTGAPLPGVGGMGPFAQVPELPGPGSPNTMRSGAPGDVHSELPDPSKLALARLANPLLSGVKPAANVVPEAPTASAEKPLGASLSVARPVRGYEPGATIAVRGSATVDAYFVLIGVNAEGHASTVFRSPSRVRSFGYAIRAQGGQGPQYLVLVASVEPPTGGDVAAALRASGQGFVSPVVVILNDAGQPGAAWSAAVNHAASLGGGTKGWKRHEWAVSSASIFTRAPAKVAVEKRAPEKAVAPKPEAGDGSILPGGSKPEMQPVSEKSVMPVVKPEVAQPKSPASPAEAPKPAPAPEGAPAKSEMAPVAAPK